MEQDATEKAMLRHQQELEERRQRRLEALVQERVANLMRSWNTHMLRDVVVLYFALICFDML